MNDQTPEPQKNSRGVLLILAAIAILVAPVIIGILISRGGTSTDTGSGAMGGETTVPAGTGFGDFASIMAGPISVDVDPSGTSAVVRVDTTIDVVCAIVYGTDTTFGGISTDDDMAGGAHATHHPVIGPLEPGTTYSYRMTGVAADGTVYRSDVMQFTTPGDVPRRIDVARGGTITDVSSEYSDTYRAENAIDGSLATEWSSNGDGDAAYIVIDLGAPTPVTGVGFRTREMSDGSAITTSFTVTVDGVPYGPFPAGPGLSTADLAVTGQVFRFDVDTSTGGNTGAVEIEIYG
jgi:hypothetical protein